MRIYLDHNSGSPLRPEVQEALARFNAERHGNPSSVHRSGQVARRMLEAAREQVAALIGAAPRSIIFTSGGTESNNLAIFGAARFDPRRRKVVSSAIEHSSVLAPLDKLEALGFEVVRLTPDTDGRISVERVLDSLGDSMALITLGLANAEVGTIQDVGRLGAAAQRAGVAFHIDAVQAAGRVPVNTGELGCDLMTLSGHKLGAPSGIGALFVRERARLGPLLLGGPQEYGLRAGTPNLSGAVAFGVATETARRSSTEENERIGRLAGFLQARLFATIPGLRRNGPESGRLANTFNFTFPGVLGESLLMALDLEGIEVSMGSACAAGAVEPSHVLRAMGRSVSEARSSLRISLGWSTTEREIELAAEVIPAVWRRVAAVEPLPMAEALQ